MKEKCLHTLAKLQIVGILNITPDSYHDGGRFIDLEKAVERAGEMLSQGADILEIGGESTFVERNDVSVDEELHRVIPVIDAIKDQFSDVKLSIDTSKAPVAKAAIDAGVSMVNDVTAGRGDMEMFSILAGESVPVVLMYAKDETSRTTTDVVDYEDVMQTVIEFLRERKQIAIDSGIAADRIILDPGLGFFVSGEAKYSFEIIAKLDQLKGLGCPIFLSPSRKSFLTGPENLPPSDRLPGTIVASAIAVRNGASYIRTHDPLEVRRGVEIVTQLR